jgi:hypothetical protein
MGRNLVTQLLYQQLLWVVATGQSLVFLATGNVKNARTSIFQEGIMTGWHAVLMQIIENLLS